MSYIKQNKDSYQLTERRSATCFGEAYPIGNGFQGAMIYGDTAHERISLNDDTLWTGFPTEQIRGNAVASFERAKKAIFEGDYIGAEREIDQNFPNYMSDAFMPLGEVTLEIKNNPVKVSNYRRALDLNQALATVKYKKGDVRYSVTAFASNPDRAIIYRIEACGKSGEPEAAISATVGMRSQLYSKVYTDGELLYLEGECPVTTKKCRERTDRKIQYYDDAEKRGMRFMAIVDIVTDGKKSDCMNKIDVSGASFCEIRIFTSTSFNGYDRHPFTEGRDYRKICTGYRERLLGKSYNEILLAHIKDYSRFFDRVKLDLGSDRRGLVPTSDRLRRFENGDADRALPALLFNFGRYLTIAASREGSQPTNLQGIWNDLYIPPWNSNYTLNINTEMNYFPTLAIDLPELYEPLLRMIGELSEKGRKTAKIFYGAEGWCCHHNSDIWRYTHPAPSPKCPQCFFWNGAGGWLCRHLVEYYEYTLDKEFLREKAYPIIRESVRFYLSQLETVDGYRMIFPTTSPENAFIYEGVRVSISETSEITMAIVRELFTNYLNICELLNVEDELLGTVKEELPRLLPTRITSDGRIMEWYREYEEREPKHRHISHLYAFYPSHYYRPDNAPELCEACRKSLEVRGNEGTGWSLAWKANMYAALRDGDMAYYFIKKQLRITNTTGVSCSNGGGSYANMFCAHPPFQIDSNFGITAAIAEMLLQSDMDTVHIIPAIPKEWENISVKGLRAKGNRKVSFTVRNGELAECEILGSMPSKILVAGKDMTCSFTYDGESANYIK